MKTNPFKNFYIYVEAYKNDLFKTIKDEIVDCEDDSSNLTIEPYEAVDPSGGQWSARGMARVHEGNFIHDLDGAGYLFAVQFNERILPGKVRDEVLATKVAELSEMTGRKPSKKDYAQLRDQVEFDLLPKAFIRRSTVHILVTPENHVIVFTSSAKKAGDTLATLQHMLNGAQSNELLFVPLEVQKDVVSVLNGIARFHPSSSDRLVPENSAVLKGRGGLKRTIRIKDRDIQSDEVQKLLTLGGEESDYDVHELGLSWLDTEGEYELLNFTLNDKLCFKRCLMPDTALASAKGEDAQLDFHSFAWLIARTYRDLIKEITVEFGGQLLQAPGKTTPTPAVDEDDEL